MVVVDEIHGHASRAVSFFTDVVTAIRGRISRGSMKAIACNTACIGRLRPKA